MDCKGCGAPQTGDKCKYCAVITMYERPKHVLLVTGPAPSDFLVSLSGLKEGSIINLPPDVTLSWL